MDWISYSAARQSNGTFACESARSFLVQLICRGDEARSTRSAVLSMEHGGLLAVEGLPGKGENNLMVFSEARTLAMHNRVGGPFMTPGATPLEKVDKSTLAVY